MTKKDQNGSVLSKFTTNILASITFIMTIVTFLFLLFMPHTVLKNDINIDNIQQSVKEVKNDVKTNYEKIQHISIVLESNSDKIDINKYKMDELLNKLSNVERSLDLIEVVKEKKCKPDDLKCLKSKRRVASEE